MEVVITEGTPPFRLQGNNGIAVVNATALDTYIFETGPFDFPPYSITDGNGCTSFVGYEPLIYPSYAYYELSAANIDPPVQFCGSWAPDNGILYDPTTVKADVRIARNYEEAFPFFFGGSFSIDGPVQFSGTFQALAHKAPHWTQLLMKFCSFTQPPARIVYANEQQ